MLMNPALSGLRCIRCATLFPGRLSRRLPVLSGSRPSGLAGVRLHAIDIERDVAAGAASDHAGRRRHALPGVGCPGPGGRRGQAVAEMRERQSHRQSQGPHGGPARVARQAGRRHPRGGRVQRQRRCFPRRLLCRRRPAGRDRHHPQLPDAAARGHATFRRPSHRVRRQPGPLAARGPAMPRTRRLRRHQLPEPAHGHPCLWRGRLQADCAGDLRPLRPAHGCHRAHRARRSAVGVLLGWQALHRQD